MNDRGFTLVELLVAFVLLMLIMTGFLSALLSYMTTRAKLEVKKRASEQLNFVSNFFLTAGEDSIKAIQTPTKFENKQCVKDISSNTTLCTFEYSNTATMSLLDNDNDGIADFYDPYNGNNDSFHTNPTSVASWMSIYPPSAGTNCQVLSASSVNLPFQCTIQEGKWNIYTGVTSSKVIYQSSNGTVGAVGRAYGIVVWYFEPFTNRYLFQKSLIFREIED